VITFSKLGKLGAMGNQLFQYAALFGLAEKNGYEIVIPIPPANISGELKVLGHSENGHPIEKYDYCLNYFSLTAKMVQRETLLDWKKTNSKKSIKRIIQRNKTFITHQYLEPHFHFDMEFFSIKDSTDLEGYFQSEKYFSHCKDKIRAEFSVKKEYQDEAREKLAMFKQKSDILISAHVRRGGHEKPENQKIHKYPPADYYIRAMEFFRSKFQNPRLLIFSDDLNWCKQNIKGKNVHYSEGNSSITDFMMMSRCDHNILTASSFSWWASWLNKNPNKIVIAPAGELFGPEGPEITSDYLSDNVIRI